MNDHRYVWLILLSFFLQTAQVLGVEDASGWKEFKEHHSIHNSVQVGGEYDTNVFKRFGGSDKDSLLRLLLKSRGTLSFNKNWKMQWNYQGGGKKYFDRDEQDLLIQYLQTPFIYTIPNRIRVLLTPELKYQEEANRVDTQNPTTQDINEDYLSLSTRLGIQFLLPARFIFQPFATYTYFRFEPNANYGFHRERGGAIFTRRFWSHFNAGSEYTYQRQQFDGLSRDDAEHEASAFIQYMNALVASVRYTFQKNDSAQNRFSFTNHRITVLLSVPIDFHQDSLESETDDFEEPLLAFHFYGTFQIKDFPSVFDYTDEGERFLLTGAEDDNFNSLVFKLSIHPLPKTTLELKYTRHSNELSSQQDSFNRTLYYGGIRYSF